jgi:cellulose synthase (UDP-forming)
VFSVRYFWWRATATFTPAALWFFYLFLAAEMLNFIEATLFYFTTWKRTQHRSPTAMPSRTVDILIATYNEPVQLLRETLICAVSVRYPHITYILDDGNRPEVRALANEIGCEYIARVSREHAKAGNLNNALRHTHGEFLVTLDADHVPMPDMIDRLLGFFADPNVAAVQTTQDFYNLDSFQHLTRWERRQAWQQQELFFSVIQPGKDACNAAFYCGSPAILRRKALEDIGGFATESVTEDMHTGLRLQKKGWRLIYYNKTVARGLAPHTFTAFATQWQRWGRGAMQVLRRERVLFSRSLSLRQRINYFSSYYYYWMSYQKLIYALVPVFCLLTGIFPLAAQPLAFAAFFLPYFLLNLLASSLLQGGLASFVLSEQYNMVKIPLLMKSLAGLFGGQSKFSVTPKSKARAARWTEVAMQLSILGALVAALAVGGWRLARAEPGYFFWATLANLLWAVFYIVLFAPVVWRAMVRKELRAAYRFSGRLNVPAKYSLHGTNGNTPFARGHARNLNRGGFSITSDSALPEGAHVDVELALRNRKIRALARVVRHHEFSYRGQKRVCNGLQFERIDPRDQDDISKYLFWEVSPAQGQFLRLTRNTQALEPNT